jgi:uncharacterized glyoxalase superfamily protein PhnB
MTASYVITDDIDAIHERVRRSAAGTVIQPPNQTQFGSGANAFTAREPEGNLWTFRTYRGAP